MVLTAGIVQRSNALVVTRMHIRAPAVRLGRAYRCSSIVTSPVAPADDAIMRGVHPLASGAFTSTSPAPRSASTMPRFSSLDTAQCSGWRPSASASVRLARPSSVSSNSCTRLRCPACQRRLHTVQARAVQRMILRHGQRLPILHNTGLCEDVEGHYQARYGTVRRQSLACVR